MKREQDRLTKRAIYAAADIAEYWIVNLPGDCVEIRREPDVATRRYASTTVARRGDAIDVGALSGARVAVSDLPPS